MRAGLRGWRVYLVLAPLIIALGFGSDVWRAVDDWTKSEAVDVTRGQAARLGGFTFELTSFSVERPIPGSSLIGLAPAGDVVHVRAKFRGRIDSARKAAKVYCWSGVENSDGLEWKSGKGTGYETRNMVRTCSRARADDGKLSEPKPHEWYSFYYDYWVPRHRAVGLRPIIFLQSQTLLLREPRYLRFAR